VLASLRRLRLKTPAFASPAVKRLKGYPKPASMSAKRWELLQSIAWFLYDVGADLGSLRLRKGPES
jgi:hypothetical protein